jgi:hypothetical protein
MTTSTFGELFKTAQKEGSFGSVLPEGDFVLRVIRAKSDAKEGKAPRIGFQVEVIRAEDDGDLGSKAWSNLYFTEKAAPISFRFLGELGLSDDYIESAESADIVAQALIGVEFDAEVSVRTWGKDNDQQSNNFKVVELVTAPVVGAVPTKPVADEEDDY